MGWGGECRRSWDADCASKSEKKVCLFASLVLFRPRVNVKELSLPGRGRFSSPKQPIFFCHPPFSEGGEGGEAAALSRGPRAVLAPRLGPAASPFRFIFPARPPFGPALLCAPTVRAPRARQRRGRSGAPPRLLRPALPGPLPFFLGEAAWGQTWLCIC